MAPYHSETCLRLKMLLDGVQSDVPGWHRSVSEKNSILAPSSCPRSPVPTVGHPDTHIWHAAPLSRCPSQLRPFFVAPRRTRSLGDVLTETFSLLRILVAATCPYPPIFPFFFFSLYSFDRTFSHTAFGVVSSWFITSLVLFSRRPVTDLRQRACLQSSRLDHSVSFPQGQVMWPIRTSLSFS